MGTVFDMPNTYPNAPYGLHRISKNPVGGWEIVERDNDDLVIVVDKRVGRIVFDREDEGSVTVRVTPKDR